MIWEAAGVLQLHPGPFTLRELLTMERRKLQTDFNGPALLAAIQVNAHKKKHEAPVHPLDLNPFYTPREKAQAKARAKKQNTIKDRGAFVAGLKAMAGIPAKRKGRNHAG